MGGCWPGGGCWPPSGTLFRYVLTAGLRSLRSLRPAVKHLSHKALRPLWDNLPPPGAALVGVLLPFSGITAATKFSLLPPTTTGMPERAGYDLLPTTTGMPERAGYDLLPTTTGMPERAGYDLLPATTGMRFC